MEPTNLSFFASVVSLFFVFNSIGQVPVFIAILAPYDHARQKRIIVRELLIALAIILLFIFFGSDILRLLGITESIIGIVGGLLLVIIALQMIFPPPGSETQGLPRHEPLIIPLAMPGLAGPGSIATVMVFASKSGVMFTAAAFFLAWIPSLILLLASSYLKYLLGEKGLKAVERLGGMLICLIGSKMFVLGIMKAVQEHFNI